MKMKMMGHLFALVLAVGLSSQALAASPNESAPQGGVFNLNLGGEPPTLHPITSTDAYAQVVQGYVMDALLAHDIETYAWKPRLAEKWEISKDNKVFTFFLRKNSFFHDGKPVTAEDVKFSFDAIFEPAYNAAHLRPYYEGIAKVEVIDPYTVKVTAKDTYFKNFDQIATMSIIPKHVYSDVEKSKKMTRTLIGSGPYALDKFERGQILSLKKFDKWYGKDDKEWKGAFNFSSINMRFYKEDAIILEHAKKGDLDYVKLTSEAYVKKTDGAPWGKTIIKHKVENSAPKNYNFIGWNFRREMFQDKDVRVALAHLMNREEMNKKFRYGMAELATGPTYIRSEYASKTVKPLLFDPKTANELLTKAGWKDSDKDGILDKTINGKKVSFRFTLIHPNKDSEKYWTMYKEDLKKAGIDMEIKYLEWNSFLKLLDEGNFDAVALAWGGGDITWDPKQIWHSSSAVAGGSNFINYKNPEVDKLIDEARQNLDEKKRKKLLATVYEKIAADAPYVFMFNERYDFYANSSKVQMPADTFKYDIGADYWWMKP
jgi:microcin C transport system substrate-binding protein